MQRVPSSSNASCTHAQRLYRNANQALTDGLRQVSADGTRLQPLIWVGLASPAAFSPTSCCKVALPQQRREARSGAGCAALSFGCSHPVLGACSRHASSGGKVDVPGCFANPKDHRTSNQTCTHTCTRQQTDAGPAEGCGAHLVQLLGAVRDAVCIAAAVEAPAVGQAASFCCRGCRIPGLVQAQPRLRHLAPARGLRAARQHADAAPCNCRRGQQLRDGSVVLRRRLALYRSATAQQRPHNVQQAHSRQQEASGHRGEHRGRQPGGWRVTPCTSARPRLHAHGCSCKAQAACCWAAKETARQHASLAPPAVGGRHTARAICCGAQADNKQAASTQHNCMLAGGLFARESPQPRHAAAPVCC
ncbi:hypothetical protein COO60DRAFT_381102 [Scenedesmus sp. NREL 46B-D3]|nr:hypothetical protein COO60DRAFT_381102 [Scenedesmus sp. NREL 46B-D3]